MVTTENVVVVCDAGPLIHLDDLGCLDLLRGFQMVLVPDAVWSEVSHHRPGLTMENWQRVTAPAFSSARLAAIARSLTLHSGEIEALRLAETTGQCWFLSDDTAARLAAKQLGVRVHGTLGLLLRAIRIGQHSREAVVAILKTLPARSTLHISDRLLREIIAETEQYRP